MMRDSLGREVEPLPSIFREVHELAPRRRRWTLAVMALQALAVVGFLSLVLLAAAVVRGQ